MAKRKGEPRPMYVDPETGDLREVGEKAEGETAKRPGLLDSIKRAAGEAIVRRTSTKP